MNTNLSVHEFRQQQIAEVGESDEAAVTEYAERRRAHLQTLQKDFNPFNADPNCKTCGKQTAQIGT